MCADTLYCKMLHEIVINIAPWQGQRKDKKTFDLDLSTPLFVHKVHDIPPPEGFGEAHVATRSYMCIVAVGEFV